MAISIDTLRTLAAHILAFSDAAADVRDAIAASADVVPDSQDGIQMGRGIPV